MQKLILLFRYKSKFLQGVFLLFKQGFACVIVRGFVNVTVTNFINLKSWSE